MYTYLAEINDRNTISRDVTFFSLFSYLIVKLIGKNVNDRSTKQYLTVIFIKEKNIFKIRIVVCC